MEIHKSFQLKNMILNYLGQYKILGVYDSSKVGEKKGCKEVTSLGVYQWSVEGITESTMIGPI